MRRVYKKRYSHWDADIKRQLRSANFRADGFMLSTLKYDPMTYVMLEDGKLIGWALVGDKGDSFSCWSGETERPIVMFYVKRRHRRQGVGTRIARRIRKDYSKVDVSYYDAPAFFYRVKLGEPEEEYV